jgi:Domain of unknown function (DUF6930)
VTVPRAEEKLKLGKRPAFAKARLQRLRQGDETWEADFRALPKPMMQAEAQSLGLTVRKRGGSVLAETKVEGRPSASDLASLLAKAMRQPLTDGAHRPRRLHVRGHRQWQELLPHLEELGIKVSVPQELPKFRAAYEDRLREMQEARRAKMATPTEEQAQVEKLFPAIAQRVRDGHIEIGDQEGFGFVAMALDYGGVVYEDDRPRTLAALENGLRKCYKEQGIGLE